MRGAGELYHLGSAQQNRQELKEQLQCLAFAQRCLVFKMTEMSCGYCTLGPGLPDAISDVLGSNPALLLTKLQIRCCSQKLYVMPIKVLKELSHQKSDNPLSEKLSLCGSWGLSQLEVLVMEKFSLKASKQ